MSHASASSALKTLLISDWTPSRSPRRLTPTIAWVTRDSQWSFAHPHTHVPDVGLQLPMTCASHRTRNPLLSPNASHASPGRSSTGTSRMNRFGTHFSTVPAWARALERLPEPLWLVDRARLRVALESRFPATGAEQPNPVLRDLIAPRRFGRARAAHGVGPWLSGFMVVGEAESFAICDMLANKRRERRAVIGALDSLARHCATFARRFAACKQCD
jgi:hypothetical protein